MRIGISPSVVSQSSWIPPPDRIVADPELVIRRFHQRHVIVGDKARHAPSMSPVP